MKGLERHKNVQNLISFPEFFLWDTQRSLARIWHRIWTLHQDAKLTPVQSEQVWFEMALGVSKGRKDSNQGTAFLEGERDAKVKICKFSQRMK